MKIESIHIENYRCFSDLTVNFDEQLTILVGINGSGKTAILNALAIFLRMYAENYYHYPTGLNLPSSDLKTGKAEIRLSCKVLENDLPDLISDDGRIDVTLSFGKNALSNNLMEASANNKFAPLVYFYKTKQDVDHCFPVVVYYAAKRSVDAYEKTGVVQAERMYAYGNAFSPQIDFSSSLSWFIDKAAEEALEGRRRKDQEYTIPELSAVRLAISKALDGYDEPYVTETPPKLFITPKGQPDQPLLVEQLSDGYRTMLALVMDLARRMAVANEDTVWPEGQTVLHSPGVVLIDEVELHLHPSWQQTVLPSLMEIFPKVQFIVTTHSPQMLTSVAANHIRILKDGKIFLLPDNEETEGADAARVLEDVLGVNPRPIPNYFAQELNRYADMVYQEQWDTPEAEELRLMLEKHYRGSEPKLQELALHVENSKWERGL